MGFMEAVRHVFKNYANFKGRARRSEYWYFYLFNFLVTMVATAVSAGLVAGGVTEFRRRGSMDFGLSGVSIVFVLLTIYWLVCLIPNLALTCRRLHDVGKPGTYMLFSLVPVVGWILILVWVLQDSMPYSNQYGPCPKQVAYLPQDNNIPLNNNVPPYSDRPHYNPAPQFSNLTLPPTAPSDLNGGGAQLMGVVGEMQGRSFVVPDRATIGRRSDCNIRYTADGVSRLHCELSYSGGTLYIQDLGSSYGTIINGSIRLEPNVPIALRAGDQISLGSSHEVLQVM